jgi:hypothetical protein
MRIIPILSIMFLFHQKVMQDLVMRYITMSQQRVENRTVNEDDTNELKQDISALRCQLIEILQQSGYSVDAYCNAGKKILTSHLYYFKFKIWKSFFLHGAVKDNTQLLQFLLK